jgi:hypothetical protein
LLTEPLSLTKGQRFTVVGARVGVRLGVAVGGAGWGVRLGVKVAVGVDVASFTVNVTWAVAMFAPQNAVSV